MRSDPYSRRFAAACIAALALASVVPGLHAQTAAKAIRVGVLLSGSETQWGPLEQALVGGLRERGYVEGDNLVVVRRYGELQSTRIRSSAAELAALRMDVIVTSCTTTTRVAAGAAPDTPIVVGSIPDPVGAGLVASFARPGGNITGAAGSASNCFPSAWRCCAPCCRRVLAPGRASRY